MIPANHDIMEVPKYEWPGGALTPRTVAHELEVRMQNHDTPNDNLIPYGYCHCGCGQKTAIAKQTSSQFGHVKGEPVKYIHGHHFRTGPRKPRIAPIVIDLKTLAIPLVGSASGKMCALVSVEDIDRLSQHRWYAKREAGKPTYAYASIPGRRGGSIIMHRFILELGNDKHVDHRNGDGLDNRRSNIRIATPRENARNSVGRLAKGAYRGVRQAGSRWHAHCGVDGVYIHIGAYDSAYEAAQARDKAVRELHGDFAVLNFPEIGERSSS